LRCKSRNFLHRTFNPPLVRFIVGRRFFSRIRSYSPNFQARKITRKLIRKNICVHVHRNRYRRTYRTLFFLRLGVLFKKFSGNILRLEGRSFEPRRRNWNFNRNVFLQQIRTQKRLYLVVRPFNTLCGDMRRMYPAWQFDELRNLRRRNHHALGIYFRAEWGKSPQAPHTNLRNAVLPRNFRRMFLDVLENQSPPLQRLDFRRIFRRNIPDALPVGIYQKHSGSIRGKHAAQHGATAKHTIYYMGNIFNNRGNEAKAKNWHEI